MKDIVIKRAKNVISFAVIFFLFATCFIVIGTETANAAIKKPGKSVITQAISSDYNAIKLSWKKTANAKKYQVYRSVYKNKGYKLVKTTTARTFTNTKLTTGKTYYYKVRGINGTVKGSYSSVKAVTPKLKTPTGLAISKKTYNNVLLKWDKVNGAKGYQIWRSIKKNGTYTKVGTTTKLVFKNTGLSSGKTYYYKIKAYRFVNGKYKYSNYSSVKAVTTNKQSYTIYYDGNGATSGSMSSSAHYYNTSKELTANSFVRTDFTFYGWNTKPDGSGDYFYDQETVVNITKNKSITLYAQWEIDDGVATNNVKVIVHTLKDGDFLLETINNNAFNVYVDYMMVFRNANGTLLTFEDPQLQYVDVKSTSYCKIYVPTDDDYNKLNYSSYSLTYEATPYEDVCQHISEIKVVESNPKYENPMFEITNTSNHSLEYVEIGILFYDQKGNIIDYQEDGNDIVDLKPNESGLTEFYTFEEYASYQVVVLHAMHYLE